jgi:tetratricopeptide (TPR) repeat protein
MLLKGRFYWNKGVISDRKKAVDYYTQAIAIDPNYAPAYAEMAYAYSILGNDGDIDPKEASQKAEVATIKALELDEGLAEAHQALAYNKQQGWDWAGAEREYNRAIELNPNYAEAHASYSMFLSLMGRHEQAVTEAKRAKELDPFSIRTNIWVFNTLFCGRRYDQALDILKQMRELDPNHPLTQSYFAFTHVTMGRYPEAIADYKDLIKLDNNNNTYARILLGYAYAKAGHHEEAQTILNELERTKQHVSPTDLAVLYAGLGKNDEAFQSLERAYSTHDLQLQYLGVEPSFDSLRSDPRFKDLMRRVGLPQ